MSDIRSCFSYVSTHTSQGPLMIITIQQLINTSSSFIAGSSRFIHFQTSLFEHDIQSLRTLFLLGGSRDGSGDRNEIRIGSSSRSRRSCRWTNDRRSNFNVTVTVFFDYRTRGAMLMSLRWHISINDLRSPSGKISLFAGRNFDGWSKFLSGKVHLRLRDGLVHNFGEMFRP